MKKFSAYLLAVLMVVSVFSVPVSALDWTENQTIDEYGNYTFDNAYGYVFNIDDVNGVINGEDATIITTEDAYMTSNPNWAVNVLLAPIGGNVYEVVTDLAYAGSADSGIDKGINFDNGNIVMLVHSAYSNPNGTNWEAKVAALALKEGDRVTLSGMDLKACICDNGTVTVLKPGEEVDSGTDTLPDTLYVPVTGFETPCSYLDGEVIVWNAGEEERVVTSDEANLRYSWFIVTDAEGKVVKIGNNLVKASEGKVGFINEVTIPAGGKLIAFSYTESSPSNKILMAVYNEALLVSNNGAAIYNTVLDIESDYYIYVEGDKLSVSRTQRDESDTEPEEPTPDEPKLLTWRDNIKYNPSNDRYVFDNAYEYTFYLNNINGSAWPDTSLIITNEDAYMNSQSNWAYNFLLAPTEDEDIYEVILDLGTVYPANGIKRGINFENGNIVFLSGSFDNAAGCAAEAIKKGDKLKLYGVDLAASTEDGGKVTVLNPGIYADPEEKFTVPVLEDEPKWAQLLSYRLNVENQDYASHIWGTASLTDGIAESAHFSENLKWRQSQWQAYVYNEHPSYISSTNAPNGIAIPTIDLGQEYYISAARVNAFLGTWAGASAPKSVSLLVSDDGVEYTQIATTAVAAQNNDGAVGWIRIAPETPVAARYVRLTLELADIWLFIDEIEIYGSEFPPDDMPSSVINLVPEHENWNVLGQGYLTFENGAPTIHAFSMWPSAETYYSNPITVNINDWYLEYDFTCTGTTNINFFFQGGEAYSFCNTALDIPAELFDASGDLPSGSYSGKVALVDIVNSCQHYASKSFPSYLIQDDNISFLGINFFAVGEEVSTTVNKFRLVSDTATVPDDDTNINVKSDPFWVTHFNAYNDYINQYDLEGAGVIYTEPYYGGYWWMHVAFAPVGNGVYEIVEIFDGTVNAGGFGIEVPEGGFVWAAEYGNNYPALGDDTKPNYTNPGVTSSINMAKSWSVGDQFIFSEIDFESFTIPTSTPDLLHYEDGYVCTATIAKVKDSEGNVIISGENLALNKPYETSPLFRMGSNWAWDENASISYPDEGGITLTDGLYAYGGYDDAMWVGFNSAQPDYEERGYHWITVDLGESQKLSEFVMYCGEMPGAGIALPNNFQVFVSEDGINWGEPVSNEYSINYDGSLGRLISRGEAAGRFVQFRFCPINWTFISEVEIYAVRTTPDDGTDIPVTPDNPTLEESIVIDGDLSDSGWKEDGWTVVTPENGYWQSIPFYDTLYYKYQLRADETKLYAAFILDCEAIEGGNGNGTNVRLWFNTNEEATLYTHFYDVFVNGTSAKYNTSTTENRGAPIENSSIDAALFSENGQTYVEFSIDLSEFGGEEKFNYFVTASNRNNENVALYYPAVNEPAEGESRTKNLPWMNWDRENQATIVTANILLGESGNDEEEFYPIPDEFELKISHQNLSNWNTYEGMIVTTPGTTINDIIGNNSNVPAIVYIAEQFEADNYLFRGYSRGTDFSDVVVPENGFLYYVCANNSDWKYVGDGQLMEYEISVSDIDINASFAIDSFSNPSDVVIISVEKGGYEIGGGDDETLEDWLIYLLGEANEDSNFDVIINAPDCYEAGDEITVEVTIQNVATKVHALSFQFQYDSNKLWLMNDLDEWENNALMCVTLPSGWENLSTVANDYADKKEDLDRVQNDDDETNDEDVQILPINNGIINASILTVSTTARDAINSITFTFTFKALEDSEGELGFVIPHDSVECARNISTGVNIMNGNGSYAITHATAVLEGYDATCTEDGLTDGLYCPDCGYIIVEQEIIPAHGHDDGKWITVIEPGMGTEGLEELYCTICCEWLDSNVLPALCNPGDVTNDGIINTYDYILIKRHVMGTYELEDIALIAADVTGDDIINTYDYILVKRHVMGTFEIVAPEAPEIPDVLPEFTNQFITLGPVSATDHATDSDAIRLTGVNVEPTYGSIVLFTREYGEITPENGLVDFEVIKFEYDHNSFGYVAQEGIGIGFKIVDIPKDGFVIAVHSSQTEYVKRMNPYLGGATAFPHGVHVYTGNDFTVERADSPLLYNGAFDNGQWTKYLVNNANPSNIGWSYEQFEANNFHTTAEYYSAYDENYLYLQVVVDSPYRYCPLTQNNASSMWNYTSLQLNISSESPDGAYIAENFNHYSNQTAATNNVVYQYGFAISDSDSSLSCCWLGKNNLDIISNCYYDGDLAIYQIAIPFANLGITPESGAKLGISFSLNVRENLSSVHNICPRNGGGIIGNNDWSKMFVVTLG